MKNRGKFFITILSVLVLTVVLSGTAFGQAAPEGKLAEVLERGKLLCGVNGSLQGFGYLDADTGDLTGFDVDYCKALAAAIFGEVTEDNIDYIQLPAAERFAALQTGQIDVLIRNTTWTMSRDSDLQGDFRVVTFYDGQGLMVPIDLGVTSINELGGARICTQSGTTTELNITDAMTSRGLEFELVPLETSADTLAAFEAGQCDVLTSDKSQLAALKESAQDPSLYTILPETLSKEPLGPMWIQGDAQWGDVVTWTVFATIYAEELGITSENIGDFAGSGDPNITRFLGEEGNLGSFIGLSNDFVVNVISEVGNYGEIYDRNLTPLNITREGSLNASYTDGGLIYVPAWR
jgi:general L-amino acid transport system substrate-binding protein